MPSRTSNAEGPPTSSSAASSPPIPPPRGSAWRTLVYGLTYADYKQFLILDSIVSSVPMRIFPQEVRNRDRMQNCRVVATTSAYQNVNKIDLVDGRFLIDADEVEDPGDDNEMRNVIILGASVSETLFPFQHAVGQSIVLNKNQYVVVGVLKERSALSSAGGGSEEFNNDVVHPLEHVPRPIRRTHHGSPIGFVQRRGGRAPPDHADDLRPRQGARRRQGVHPPARTQPLQERLERHRAARSARRGGARQGTLFRIALRHRLHLARGGRHRHHEHHARHRHRTHPRDRHPPRPRRQTLGHHAAIPDRSNGANHCRRRLPARHARRR